MITVISTVQVHVPVSHRRRQTGPERSLRRQAPARSSGGGQGGAGEGGLAAAPMRLARAPFRRLSALSRHLPLQARRKLARAAPAPAPAPASSEVGVLDALTAVEYEAAGFDVLRQEWIAEMASEATLLRHRATGAEVMSVINDDENKTFAALFKTPPKDSTGIAHILEHSVLCGSRDYPLKEPFVELLKSSQQTFLNAMTYPDRTVYPVASCNLADFYNLVDVYLNAVFFPRAAEDPMVLAQEGWHFEPSDDGGEALRMSGVVYNEMKGVYSDPDAVLMNIAIQSLSPDNTYGIDSGGDPAVIPQLTFQQFRDTWAEWYHPSNGRFWFSGNDPPAERLAIMDKYLNEFVARSVDTGIPMQPPAPEPKVVRKGYEVGEEDEESGPSAGRAMVLVSWMIHGSDGGRLDPETALAFEVLNRALMGSSAAPLRKALDDSNLGSQVIGGGLDDDLLQPFFMVGLKGVAEEDSAMQAVQQVVLDVLTHHAQHGFEPSWIAATMNTFEFTLRENNTGSMPRGLVNMLRSSGAWVHEGGDGLFENLKYEDRLQALKTKLADGQPVFQGLLQQYLLSNGHRVTVEMVPDPQVGPARVAAEEAMIQKARQEMGPNGVKQVIAEAAALQQIQHTPDPPEVLAMVPHLSIEDMPPSGKEVPTQFVDLSSVGLGSGSHPGVEWLQHDLPTNGIIYVNMAFDLGAVQPDDVPLLSLFASCLKQNGLTTGEDFVAVAERIGATTGGVSASVVNSVVRGRDEPQAHLIVSGKSMAAQAGELSAVISDLLLHANLDNQQRVSTLVGEMVANMESSVLGAGHAMCLTRLNAAQDLSGWMDEQLGGVSALHHLRKLQKDIKNDWPSVLQQLANIKAAVVNSGALTIDVTADAESLSISAPAVAGIVRSLPPPSPDVASQGRFAWGHVLSSMQDAGDEAFVVPTQVNYVAKGGKCDLSEDLFGVGLVLSKLLGTSHLWDQVRVVGGAYGVFGVYDWRRGVFNYVSYRDPKLSDTLAAYDATAAFVEAMELDEGGLTKVRLCPVLQLSHTASVLTRNVVASRLWCRRSASWTRRCFPTRRA